MFSSFGTFTAFLMSVCSRAVGIGAGGQSEVTTASEYLQKRRTFKGLEAPVVGAEKKPVIKAVQGQTGRAAQYTHEAAS